MATNIPINNQKETEPTEETQATAETVAQEATAETEPISGEVIVDPETEESETPATDAPSQESLQTALAQAQEDAAQYKDNWHRAAAEMSNYKRRQEEQAARRQANLTGQIISQIFPALDDLDLAFQNLPADLNEQDANWVEGFRLVQRKLLKLLEDNRVKEISTQGEFDPNLHEAITFEANPDVESNHIIAELRKGYAIGEQVLRPSLVRVAQ